MEQSYGGPEGFRVFVKEAHARGLGVILDVVYNHFGPDDLHLWRFDGWSEHDGGGIYFYNDHRASTPWGRTRPDYGRPEVRAFIRDNALMWLEEHHVDGLRFDMTLYMRTVDGEGSESLPDGWSLAQWVNDEVQRVRPGALTIAEDLQHNDWLTRPTAEGGAGFGAQWDARFVHPVRQAVIAADDDHRSMHAVAGALKPAAGDAFRRVIYSESHDEVANGKARVPHEIAGGAVADWFAQKRSTLAAALVFTAPGIPMIFQGQEFLQGGWCPRLTTTTTASCRSLLVPVERGVVAEPSGSRTTPSAFRPRACHRFGSTPIRPITARPSRVRARREPWRSTRPVTDCRPAPF